MRKRFWDSKGMHARLTLGHAFMVMYDVMEGRVRTMRSIDPSIDVDG